MGLLGDALFGVQAGLVGMAGMHPDLRGGGPRAGCGGPPCCSCRQPLNVAALAAVMTVVLTGTLASALPARALTACCTASLPSSLGSWATVQFKVPALTAACLLYTSPSPRDGL